jgi:hypothetical protein
MPHESKLKCLSCRLPNQLERSKTDRESYGRKARGA